VLTVIPFRAEGKSRLPEDLRREVALAMLGDVVEVALAVGDVRVVTGDTMVTPYGGGTWGSRGAGIGGEATIQSGKALKENILKVAAVVLETDALDEGRPADGDEHQVAVGRLAVPEVHGEVRAVVVDLRALLRKVLRDPPLAERLLELLRGVLVLGRDQVRQHLDDRDLGAEAVEDRGELAADDPAPEDHESRGHLGGGQEPRRVDAAG